MLRSGRDPATGAETVEVWPAQNRYNDQQRNCCRPSAGERDAMDMDREVARRDFLKTAQAAVGMLAYGQGTAANAADQPKAPAAAVIISGAADSPVLDHTL